MENYATEEEKTRLQETLPARAQELSATQRAFLHILASALPHTNWEGDALQIAIFNAARLTPIDQPNAFKAIYRVLLDRMNGPKAGNFLSFLEREFVVQRFSELPVDKLAFWKETGLTEEAFEQWLVKEQSNIKDLSAKLDFSPSPGTATSEHEHGSGVIEFIATMADGKTHCKRVLSERFQDTPGEKEFERFSAHARQWVGKLQNQISIKLQETVEA